MCDWPGSNAALSRWIVTRGTRGTRPQRPGFVSVFATRNHFNTWNNLIAGNQARPVADDRMNSRTTLGVACRPLRSCCDERHQFASKSLDRLASFSFHSDSQHGFVAKWGTHTFHDTVPQFDARFMYALQNEFSAAAGFFHGLSADDRQRSGCSEPVAIRGTDFQCRGRRRSDRAADSYPIVAEIVDVERQKRNRRIRAEVVRRIADFINELFLDGHSRDSATRVTRFCDDTSSVARHFHDRKAEVRWIGHVEPVGADATGDLRAAFDQMSGNCRSRQFAEIVPVPTEVLPACRHDQRGIGDAARDDNVGCGRERLDNRSGADIRVRRNKPTAHIADSNTGIEIAKLAGRLLAGRLLCGRLLCGCANRFEDIVARHDADIQRPTSGLF